MQLRVLNNCSIGGCASMNVQSTCPGCPNWTPSRGSKYYRCNRWLASRVVCDLPRSSCATCDQHVPKGSLPQGRPNTTGMDWRDPEQLAEYNREAKRASRRRRAVSQGR